MAVLREPVSATFSGVLGSMASIETTAGTGEFRRGRPGLHPAAAAEQPGLGRHRGVLPRAYVGGRCGRHARYFASAEFNFERVPVAGRDRLDRAAERRDDRRHVVCAHRFRASRRPTRLTIEGSCSLPGDTPSSGLSPLRPRIPSPDVDVPRPLRRRRRIGWSLTRRRDLLTLPRRRGRAQHRHRAARPRRPDPTPDGWLQNWFSAVDVSARRVALSGTWERSGLKRPATMTSRAPRASPAVHGWRGHEPADYGPGSSGVKVHGEWSSVKRVGSTRRKSTGVSARETCGT